MKNIPNFLVDVRCFTFNQSGYITDTMNGFCMQKTNFPFICCIVDDASTDGEQEVIEKYLEDNFELSKESGSYKKETDYGFITYARHKTNDNCYFYVIFLKENHYSNPEIEGKKMSYISHWRCLCKYEAMCEGDDYWIDNEKLSKQISFLERNKSYLLVYTKAQKVDKNGLKLNKTFGNKNSEKITNLICNNDIPTLSVCYRRYLYDEYEKIFTEKSKKWLMGDYPFWLYVANKGKIKYLNEVTACYRVLEISASHNTNLSKNILFLKNTNEIRYFFIDKYFPQNLQKSIKARVYSKLLLELFYLYLQYKQPQKAIDILIKEYSKVKIFELSKMIVKLFIYFILHIK